MDYFLQLFGDITIGKAVVFLCAIGFMFATYKKIEKYITDKAFKERENNEKFNQVIDQVEQYPKWHEQSIDIRTKLTDSINGLGKKLDSVNHSLGELRRENGENQASTFRYRILRFDDEIRHDAKHTKEHFDQILEDITEYEKYCNSHPDYRNNKAVLAIENIKRIYRECSDEGTFL